MNIIAAIYTRKAASASSVTAIAGRVGYQDNRQGAAGSLLGYVFERAGRLYFLNDDMTQEYGMGEVVSNALKPVNRAKIAARRHFGRDIVVA